LLGVAFLLLTDLTSPKSVPFFSKEQRTQSRLFFFTEVQDRFFSQQILSSDYFS